MHQAVVADMSTNLLRSQQEWHFVTVHQEVAAVAVIPIAKLVAKDAIPCSMAHIMWERITA